LNLDEDSPGDDIFEVTGSSVTYSWIECGYGSVSIPTGATITAMTIYIGYKTTTKWSVTATHKGIIWSTTSGGTEHDIADYRKSVPDKDTVLTTTSDLPTRSELDNGIYLRVSGYDTNGGGADFLSLDYLYFAINYTISEVVINEVMYDPTGNDDNSGWVELYNAGGSAVDLTGWNLSDNDGNTFNLSGAGSMSAGGYLMCYLSQAGTNSSTTVYGPIVNSSSSPNAMLDSFDDLAFLDNNQDIIDYLAWGGNPGTDDNDAVSALQWTNNEYIDTSSLSEGETLGRDKDSTDNDTTSNWEDGSSLADPFGIDSPVQTPGAQNQIPEFDLIFIPLLLMAIIFFYFKRGQKSKLSQGRFSKRAKEKPLIIYKKG
jgi:hypothetical protein